MSSFQKVPMATLDHTLALDVTFAGFRLSSTERLLQRGGAPVEIGSRALDILIVLVRHAGHIISSHDLIKAVWADVVVEESCLRVHISSLRKALALDDSCQHYITNVPGRGYRFVVPFAQSDRPLSSRVQPQRPCPTAGSLPPMLARMIGHESTVATLSSQLNDYRFITITGPGGIGKTTVAVAVAHAFMIDFDGSICFLDLEPVTDPAELVRMLATELGFTLYGKDALQALVTHLQDRRWLLVLDNCEHLVDSVALMAQALFRDNRNMHVLVTSRETLRIEGESVHRLGLLETPPRGVHYTAISVMAYSAVRLFVERAKAHDDGFSFSDEEAPLIAHICRRFDGLPLALEIVAGKVAMYGVQGVIALMDGVELTWTGRRTASPRHNTLRGALAWSYRLLSAPQASALGALALLTGAFSLDTAKAAIQDGQIDETRAVEWLGELVERSLVWADGSVAPMRYQLLHVTRAFVLEMQCSAADGEPGSSPAERNGSCLGV